MSSVSQSLRRSWTDVVGTFRQYLEGVWGRHRAVIAGAVAALLLVVWAGWSLLGPHSTPAAAATRFTPTSVATAVGVAPTTTLAAPAQLVVQASGAVAHPGVYRVAADARVTDVVVIAGGLTADADLDRVNLAAKVADGELIYILRRGQVMPQVSAGTIAGNPGATAVPSAPVDLNVATATDLDALPGVGPATAQAIVDYRQAHGRFRSVDDLAKVKGIGPGKLTQLRPHVRV